MIISILMKSVVILSMIRFCHSGWVEYKVNYLENPDPDMELLLQRLNENLMKSNTPNDEAITKKIEKFKADISNYFKSCYGVEKTALDPLIELGNMKSYNCDEKEAHILNHSDDLVEGKARESTTETSKLNQWIHRMFVGHANNCRPIHLNNLGSIHKKIPKVVPRVDTLLAGSTIDFSLFPQHYDIVTRGNDLIQQIGLANWPANMYSPFKTLMDEEKIPERSLEEHYPQLFHKFAVAPCERYLNHVKSTLDYTAIDFVINTGEPADEEFIRSWYRAQLCDVLLKQEKTLETELFDFVDAQ